MSEQQNVQTQGKTDLHRTLQQRHLTMIGIGGAIGTGLWFASGEAISYIGPGGSVLVYAVMGALVYFLMTSLGEMATHVPLSGSFETYASKFIDPALGFAMGWNYYLSWTVTVTFEIVAGAKILEFWLPPEILPAWIPSLIFFCLLFGLNFLSARVFGEAEFWFAGIKVITVVIFLVVGLLMVIGVIGDAPGAANWTHEAADGRTAPFAGGVGAIMTMFLLAAFSFQGTELVGLSAGEASNPEKTIPKAINSVFWRIILFYMGGILIIATLIPFDHPYLLESGVESVAFSPFTIVFHEAGLGIAATVMNFVILTSVLSCGNSGLYCATRMLYAMANEGKAPMALAKTSSRGVPLNALLITSGLVALGFVFSLFPQIYLFDFLLNASGMMGMFGWLGIAWCHWRFRRAYVIQGGRVEDLKYKAKFYPAGPIIGMILCVIVILGSNIWVFDSTGAEFWYYLISSYFPLPVFLLLYGGYKYKMGTKIVKLEDCDFSTEYQRYVKVKK